MLATQRKYSNYRNAPNLKGRKTSLPRTKASRHAPPKKTAAKRLPSDPVIGKDAAGHFFAAAKHLGIFGPAFFV